MVCELQWSPISLAGGAARYLILCYLFSQVINQIHLFKINKINKYYLKWQVPQTVAC